MVSPAPAGAPAVGAPANGTGTSGTPTGPSGAGDALAGKGPAQGMPRGRTKKELAAAMRGVPLNGLSQGGPSPSLAQAPGQETPTVLPPAEAPAVHQPGGPREEGAVAVVLRSGGETAGQGQAGNADAVEGEEGPAMVNGSADTAAPGVPGGAGPGEGEQIEPREEVKDSDRLILPGCAVGPTLAWHLTSVSVPVVYRGGRGEGWRVSLGSWRRPEACRREGVVQRGREGQARGERERERGRPPEAALAHRWCTAGGRWTHRGRCQEGLHSSVRVHDWGCGGGRELRCRYTAGRRRPQGTGLAGGEGSGAVAVRGRRRERAGEEACGDTG